MRSGYVRASVLVSLLLGMCWISGGWIVKVEAVGSPWNISIVDSAGDVGSYSSLALDSMNRPHISYRSYTGGDLKYASWTGSSWSIGIVDSAAGGVGYSSLALDSMDRPRISYYNFIDLDLYYANWTGSSWDLQRLVWDGDIGDYSSLALDSADRPHISVHDCTSEDLSYADHIYSVWSWDTVDAIGNVGSYSSLALDSMDRPHVSYYDSDPNNDLKYANGTWTGYHWDLQTVDSAGNVGSYSSLALDSMNRPHISYYDSYPNDDLKYASWTGSSWSISTVDSAGHVGDYSSLALDSMDRPHISYCDGSNDRLKYASWTGSSWSIGIVDSTAGGVGYSSLALDSMDNPHISYKDYTNDDLKYATGVSHDLAMASVKPFVSAVGQGYGCKINATVSNLGVSDENVEVTVNAQIRGTTDGLAGYWGFDQTSGTTAFDISGNHNDGRFSAERAWEWQTLGDVEGWIPWNEVADFSCDGVSLNGRATGNDPHIHSPSNLAIDSVKARTVHLRMNVSAASPAQIFFITDLDTNWDEAKSKVFNTQNPNQWVEYRVSFADVPGWTGTIKQIRLDPVNDVVGATFSVDWLRVGSNPRWVSGFSLSLDGLDDHVSAPFIPLNDRSFTITAWFAAKSLPSYPNDLPIVTQDAEHTPSNFLHVLVRNGKPYFGFFNDDLQGNTVINKNTFYHIACVYNYSSNRKLIYINGELDASGSSAGAYKGTSGETEIGYYYAPGPEIPRCYFNGTLDEVRIYDRALNRTQIRDAMNSGACVWPQTVSLPKGEETTLTFTWDTTGWPMANYTMCAVVWPVGGETATADNVLIDGWVLVTLTGDVNADRKVDLKDVYAVGKAYGSSRGPDGLYWHSPPKVCCPHSPNCDINGDDKVDLKDYYATTKNYGKSW